MSVVPITEGRVKENSREWFENNIADEIKNRDKSFKICKRSKLRIDKLRKILIIAQDINYRKRFLVR